VKTERTPGGFQLQVADAGRGIEASQLARIGAYSQFDREHHEQQGSGLGLAIAKLLTELHGGSLWLESIVGTGTTAHVQLPVEERHTLNL
jgi:signal transduction histidine kinase